MIKNKEDVRKMDPKARKFIGEIISMFNLNQLNNLEIEIIPKTKKAFKLICKDRFGNIFTEDFSAQNLTSPNGIFKVARLINYICLHDM